MKGIIDRMEDKYAVVETENGRMHLSVDLLPEGAKEGSHLILEGDQIRLDSEGERALRARIQQLSDEIFH